MRAHASTAHPHVRAKGRGHGPRRRTLDYRPRVAWVTAWTPLRLQAGAASPKMEPSKNLAELQKFYHQMLRPLSLFPRQKPPPESPRRPSQDVPMLPPLPVWRLTAASLSRQVALQLEGIKLEMPVPPKARLCFTNVILDEIKCSWQEPPCQLSLSHVDNLRLRKRLQAHVLFTSELLFLHYLYLLVTMATPEAVFTESAMLTRLAASLARDCTRFLTSPEVSRSLLAELQAQLEVEQSRGSIQKLRIFGSSRDSKACEVPPPRRPIFGQVPSTGLSLNYLIQLSRPRDFLTEPEQDAMMELKSIPQLKKKRPLRWLSSVQKKKQSDTGALQVVSLPKEAAAPTGRCVPTSPAPGTPLHSQIHRGQSMPSLREGWKLADELGLPPLPPRPLSPLILVTESKPTLAGDVVAEDLKKTIKEMKIVWAHYSSLESGLPPLVGTLTYRPSAQEHVKELQRMLKDLEEEEHSERSRLQAPRPDPVQSQPVTVTVKLRDQGVVQAAAVQISERTFVDSFHVEGAGVLYNHLTGELDSKVIEKMDIERYMGNSIREIYTELMSRVSTKHFAFDQGPLVEPTANTDWSSLLFSASLGVENQYYAVNPKLVGLASRKTSLVQSTPDKIASFSSLHSVKHLEKRNNSSWFNWWKKTVTSSDYFKFLSKQQTDFLHVIFQMYQEEPVVETVPTEKEFLKIEQPPPLLNNEEPDFVPGEWNWSTVLEYGAEMKDEVPGESQKILDLQERLHRLWSMLEVPSKDRLDMAIKYSSNTRLGQLPSLVSSWELVLQPIQLREKLLARLEWFEWQASDPNRFYQKTKLGPTYLREESRIRNQLHQKLCLLEKSLVSLLRKIELFFGEPVTLQGRRYLDKMKRDKVEMLFWLQQRRRLCHLLRVQSPPPPKAALSKKASSKPLTIPGSTSANQ
ncbi:coiled-coil domain-containing protein 87 [Erinaceus europaeus]|uniref:Coiled-coil domain-containing protein 87 n=1 Tax=Erinaceus europaeus TaxID=9365 RepID=A0A1S2ZG28_ERIEU|nr:coiled-coil domain-containing protein 87 [Erinaceus europaeus]